MGHSTLPHQGGDTPSPHPTSLGTYGVSILAPTALELSAALVPPFAYPGDPLFLFLGNDPWFYSCIFSSLL